jgi:Transposase DDE domain
MYIAEFSHKYLKNALPKMHATRLNRLIESAKALLGKADLSLSSIGRHTSGAAKVKNKIKSVDRILSNRNCLLEKADVYKALAAKIIGSLSEIDVLVDWSSVESHEHHMLRASVVFEGRAITIYQEVYPEKLLGKYDVHKKFLERLKNIIPKHCHAHIITDAGFRTEWFELVLEQGWDFTGRILSNMHYKWPNKEVWEPVCELYKKATDTPQYIGEFILAKKRKLKCFAHLYSEVTIDKNKKNNKVVENKDHKMYRKRHYTPWLLVTSKSKTNAKKVVNTYRRRMKIEHDFRDTKSSRWGLGLSFSRTTQVARLEILLLISTLALFMLWLVGLAAENKKLQYSFQANTIKSHRVLSLIFLGMQVLEHLPNEFTCEEISHILLETQDKERAWLEAA